MTLDKSLSLLESQMFPFTKRVIGLTFGFLWALSSDVQFANEKMQVQSFPYKFDFSVVLLLSMAQYVSL